MLVLEEEVWRFVSLAVCQFGGLSVWRFVALSGSPRIAALRSPRSRSRTHARLWSPCGCSSSCCRGCSSNPCTWSDCCWCESTTAAASTFSCALARYRYLGVRSYCLLSPSCSLQPTAQAGHAASNAALRTSQSDAGLIGTMGGTQQQQGAVATSPTRGLGTELVAGVCHADDAGLVDAAISLIVQALATLKLKPAEPDRYLYAHHGCTHSERARADSRSLAGARA